MSSGQTAPTPAGALAGRLSLVTGGGRGLGSAIAIGLGQAGSDVIITYQSNRRTALQTVELIEAAGARAWAHPLEVTDKAAIAGLAETIVQSHDGLAVLVNNAGINKPTDFDQITEEDWDEILAVNLKGPFLIAQSFLPLLRKGAAHHGDASILNIGSVSGQYGGPRTAHYAASKAGLISLSQVMARFGAGDGIRANTLAAGIIQSDMGAAGLAAPAVQQAAEAILLKRLGSPQEVAEAAVFLASPASRYITGQTLNVNGGLYF